MLENNSLVTVVNRDNGTVGYVIPDLGNLSRTFQPKESKQITMEELRKLSFVPGGNSLLKNYLMIQNKEAAEELVSDIEPEYYYTDNDLKEILLRGSIPQLEDCLDFAPWGVLENLKDLAIKLRINDLQKRELISKKMNINISSAINANVVTEEADNTEEVKTRRTAPIAHEESKAPVRRTAPKYNVVSK